MTIVCGNVMLILENKNGNVKILREFQLPGQAQESFRGTFDRGEEKSGKKAEKGASVPVYPEPCGGHDRAVCDPHAFAG